MGRAFEVRKAAMAKTSAAKAKVYSRFGKEIYVAAKSGVPDPDMNQTLKQMIQKAKANQVPADVITRAIEKAKGATHENYDTVRYEGFGPGASTIIVECLTDNVNRSIADVRTCFNKAHAKLGVAGSVSFNYEFVSLIAFPGEDEEAVLEALVNNEIDARDFEVVDGMVNITAEASDLYRVKTAIEEIYPNIEFTTLETTMLPNEYVTLQEGEETDYFTRLTTMLDDVDDVQNVWHNVAL